VRVFVANRTNSGIGLWQMGVEVLGGSSANLCPFARAYRRMASCGVNLHIVPAGQISNERRSSALRVAGSQHSIMFVTTYEPLLWKQTLQP
jgi:hypothetical protein